jgi:hypothetical protein
LSSRIPRDNPKSARIALISDLIERLAAKVLDFQQFLFSALHQLADIFDIGVPQSVKRTHRKRQSLDWAKKDLVHRHGCDLILEPVISGKED